MKPTQDRKVRLAQMRYHEALYEAQLQAAPTEDERFKLRGHLEALRRNIGTVERAGLAVVKPKATPPSTTPKRVSARARPIATTPPVTTPQALRRADRALLTMLRQPGLSSRERTAINDSLHGVRVALVAEGEALPPVAAPTRDDRLARMDRVVAHALGKDKSTTMNVGGHQLVGVPFGWQAFPTVA